MKLNIRRDLDLYTSFAITIALTVVLAILALGGWLIEREEALLITLCEEIFDDSHNARDSLDILLDMDECLDVLKGKLSPGD